jgi:gluconolactonase
VTRAAALAFLPLCLPAAAQNFDHFSVVKVATGYTFADGPAWSPEGSLVFSDVAGNRLLKLAPGSHAAPFREGASGPGGNAFDADGRLYTCQTRARRVVRWDRKGSPEVLADRFEGKRLNAPNDIAVRKDGHAWFTDPAFGYQQDARELDFNGIFHLTPRREVRLVAKSATRPNGVALSPNGRVLYVTDSDAHTVRAWDLDGKGEAANDRVLVSGIEGVPAGIRTHDKGNIYVAAGSAIAVSTPAGKALAAIPLGEPASNCAFGDADMKSLYITARSSVYRVRLDDKEAVEH